MKKYLAKYLSVVVLALIFISTASAQNLANYEDQNPSRPGAPSASATSEPFTQSADCDQNCHPLASDPEPQRRRVRSGTVAAEVSAVLGTGSGGEGKDGTQAQ